MKPIFLALTMVGFLLPLVPRAQADPEVSLDVFYDNLSPYGGWIEVEDYGYCFQPTVAIEQSDWRPYADGYWAYTDVGWTWVSYEDFGWATYHYGRWANLDDYGWVWVPGYEWGPAWVSWRTGGDYIGWAPLLAQPVGVVFEGRPISGAVDITFGIGPLYYNFVDIRYIGEPVLRRRLIEPRRNLTIINSTVNVTNITYNNTTVINRGPDINRLDQYSARPIPRLKLQREAGDDFAGRRGNLNRVQGNELVVAAPALQRSPRQLAPKQVKAKVAQPKIQKGWQGVDNRQQLEAEMKKENAQNVPPPTFQPTGRRAGPASTGIAGAAGQADPAPQNAERVQRPATDPQDLNTRSNRKAGKNGEWIADVERPAEKGPAPKAMRAQPADPSEQSHQSTQPDLRDRPQPFQQAQPDNERPERVTRANQGESQQPERVRRLERVPEQEPSTQQPQAIRRPQQVRPQLQQRPPQGPGNQAPAGDRPRSKKKPGAEPTP